MPSLPKQPSHPCQSKILRSKELKEKKGKLLTKEKKNLPSEAEEEASDAVEEKLQYAKMSTRMKAAVKSNRRMKTTYER